MFDEFPLIDPWTHPTKQSDVRKMAGLVRFDRGKFNLIMNFASYPFRNIELLLDDPTYPFRFIKTIEIKVWNVYFDFMMCTMNITGEELFASSPKTSPCSTILLPFVGCDHCRDVFVQIELGMSTKKYLVDRLLDVLFPTLPVDLGKMILQYGCEDVIMLPHLTTTQTSKKILYRGINIPDFSSCRLPSGTTTFQVKSYVPRERTLKDKIPFKDLGILFFKDNNPQQKFCFDSESLNILYSVREDRIDMSNENKEQVQRNRVYGLKDRLFTIEIDPQPFPLFVVARHDDVYLFS